MASLRRWAKEDSGGGSLAEPVTATTPSPTDEETRDARMLDMMRSLPRFSAVAGGRFTATSEGVRFELSGGVSGMIDRASKDVRLKDGEYVGNLVPFFKVHEPLSYLHPNITPQATIFDCEIRSANETVLTSSPHNTRIGLVRNLGGDYNVAFINVEAKREMSVASAKKLTAVSTMLAKASDAMLRERWGNTFGMFSVMNMVNMVNTGTINIHLSQGVSVHNERDLVTALLKEKPELGERVRFAPDAKVGNCNGLYCCDPRTNVWAQEHNANIEEMLLDEFESLQLKTDDMNHLKSRRGRNDMLYAFAAKVSDKHFVSRLDSNLDLFAVDNGVFFWTGAGFEFRGIEPTDYITTTAGWAYDPEQAKTHRSELERFLGEVFPVADERKIVIGYFASLLSGRRSIRKFLILSDERSGSNGKTTVSKLMMMFFGEYAKSSTKFVCRASYEGGRDSHGAGTEPFKGKRLLVADELKHTMTIDEAMLKKYTGGTNIMVEDRKLGQSQWFKFTWQAGIVLIFNEGDMPRMDVADEAFVGRMVVAPMRSKFVDGQGSLDDEEYTFRMNKDIDTTFKLWLPALAELLIDAFDTSALDEDKIPAAMREWRQGITSENNVVAEWLDQSLEVTGDLDDIVLVAGLFKEFKAISMGASGFIKSAEFCRLCKVHMGSYKGVTFKDYDSISRNAASQATSRKKTARNCIRGVVFKGVECPQYMHGDMIVS